MLNDLLTVLTKREKVVVLMLFGVGLLSGGGCGTAMLSGGVPYSEGYRDGHVQKLSHRGLIWKNHEGQMVLPGFKARLDADGSSSLTNFWSFTADGPETARAIEQFGPDDLVRLHYREVLLCPPWKGDSGYIVWKAERIGRDKRE